MKLVQLNLRAYGPFTNKMIDFEDAAGSAPESAGLHLLLGANEAGKSTALRGLRAVLFGMSDMRDAHLHPKDMLRVAVKIRTTEGELLHVERRKGKGAKSLLFVETEKAVPVEDWSRILPVDDADLFEQMFGLNYERLLAGGRQLAEFKSDIGQALLAAAGDIGETVARMREMQQCADAIYSPRATSSKLRQALSAYQTADKAFRDERYTSREYKAAVSRADEIGEELARIVVERARSTTEQHRLTRLQTAAPHVQRLLEDEKAQEAYGSAVALADGFEARFNTTVATLRTAEGRRDDSIAELERLNRELANVQRDPGLAALVAEIDQLKDISGKILGARADRPKREAEWKTLSSARDGLCSDLGVAIDALPRLRTEQRKRIELLSGKHLVLAAKRAELPARISGLESSLCDAELALSEVPTPLDTGELAEGLAQVRAKKQPESEVKRLRFERDQFAQRLNRDLSALPFWSGTPEQLETARTPLTISVNEFAERFVKHEALEQQLIEGRRKVIAQVEGHSDSLRRLERQKAIPTEMELASARALRGNRWAAVKDCWLRGVEGGLAETTFLGNAAESLPEAYESAVTNADSVADDLRLEAERVEQKRTALEALDGAKKCLRECERDIVEHRAELVCLEAKWTSLWADAGIAPRSPREMQAWLETRATLVGQWRDLGRLTNQVIEAEEEVKRWRESLGTLLGDAGASSLADLVQRAEVRVRESAEIRQKRIDRELTVRQLRSNLDAALRESRKNEAELAEWRTLWGSAIAGLPVTVFADPASVYEVVKMIDAVFDAVEEMDRLQYRIDAMRADETRFIAAVRSLSIRAGRHELVEGDPLLAIGRLHEMARVAQTNETRATGIMAGQAREQQKLSEAENAVARHEKTLNDLMSEARTNTASLVPEAIRANQKRIELERLIDGHRRALTSSCGSLSLYEFVAQVRAIDIDLLPSAIDRVREEIGTLEDEKTKFTSERDAIDKEFQVREAAVALRSASCEKEFAAARIKALTAEYIEQQLGSTLLAKATALYREKHQDPLLKRAGEYFTTLTCRAFVGLAIDEDENQRVLKGIRGNGGAHLDVDAMSDGTRDQLFLALRLAYIENYCDNTSVCPVILDDVLMAFDDERTAATLSALQELSRKTQVLVFTHHEHHVTLAKTTLGEGGYHLHELSSEFSTGAA
jgi:uncharacterized protein YhaN